MVKVLEKKVKAIVQARTSQNVADVRVWSVANAGRGRYDTPLNSLKYLFKIMKRWLKKYHKFIYKMKHPLKKFCVHHWVW